MIINNKNLNRIYFFYLAFFVMNIFISRSYAALKRDNPAEASKNLPLSCLSSNIPKGIANLGQAVEQIKNRNLCEGSNNQDFTEKKDQDLSQCMICYGSENLKIFPHRAQKDKNARKVRKDCTQICAENHRICENCLNIILSKPCSFTGSSIKGKAVCPNCRQEAEPLIKSVKPISRRPDGAVQFPSNLITTQGPNYRSQVSQLNTIPITSTQIVPIFTRSTVSRASIRLALPQITLVSSTSHPPVRRVGNDRFHGRIRNGRRLILVQPRPR